MKKSIVTSILLIVFVLTGCKKDDDDTQLPEPTNQELVLGRWSLVSISPGDELSACRKQSSLIFLEEGTFLQSYYTEDSDGNCNLNSNVPADYSFSAEDLIKIGSGSDTIFITIMSISKEQLVLRFDSEEGVATITLKK